MGSVGNKIMNCVAAVVVVVLTVCAVRFNAPQYREYKNSITLRDKLRERNAESSAKLSELISNQERFRSDEDFIIHLAHAHHRAFKDEVVFVFPGPASDSNAK